MKFKRVTNRITPHLNKKAKALKKVARPAYDKFVEETPVKTGNARRRTTLKETTTKSSIRADYDYARRLDEGYSKQAPDGMSAPTIDFIINEIRKLL